MTVGVGQQMKADDLLKLTFFPVGTILMYNGTWVNGTGGWYVCNGEHGTPNLVDRFIKGGNNASGSQGGNNTYNLTEAQLPSHTHGDNGHTHAHSHTAHTGAWGVDDYGWHGIADAGNSLSGTTYNYDADSSGGNGVKITMNAKHNKDETTGYASLKSVGSGANIDNQPLFYTLVYIMKVVDPSNL